MSIESRCSVMSASEGEQVNGKGYWIGCVDVKNVEGHEAVCIWQSPDL
jgi:hypothetical protein